MFDYFFVPIRWSRRHQWYLLLGLGALFTVSSIYWQVSAVWVVWKEPYEPGSFFTREAAAVPLYPKLPQEERIDESSEFVSMLYSFCQRSNIASDIQLVEITKAISQPFEREGISAYRVVQIELLATYAGLTIFFSNLKELPYFSKVETFEIMYRHGSQVSYPLLAHLHIAMTNSRRSKQ